MRLEIGDGFIVGFIGFCIYKLIEFKAVLRYIVHSVPKGCDHLIGALLIFQVQQDFRVGLPEIFLLIFHDRPEHRAIEHIVPVNQQIVALRQNAAIGIDKG